VAQQLFLSTNNVDFFELYGVIVTFELWKVRHDEEAMQLRLGQEVIHEKK